MSEPDLDRDVMPISGGDFLSGERLVNFHTAKADLLPAHKKWLSDSVIPHFKKPQGAWVDLIGYASHRGNRRGNLYLSERRMQSVKNFLSADPSGAKTEFNITTFKGDTESAGGPNDNNGYYRAVNVYVYGGKKPSILPNPPAQPTKFGSTNWKMRLMGAASPGLGIGIAFQEDWMGFELVDVDNQLTASFEYIGEGWGLGPVKIPVPLIALAGAGPFKPFKTSTGVLINDFEGAAGVVQDAGAAVGDKSVGGTVELHINSVLFRNLGAHVIGGYIKMTADTGISLGFGSTTNGDLYMKPAKVFPYAGN